MFWKISLTCYNLCVDTWKPCSRKDIHTYHTTTVSSSLSSHCLAHVQLFMAFNAKTTLNFFCFVFSFFLIDLNVSLLLDKEHIAKIVLTSTSQTSNYIMATTPQRFLKPASQQIAQKQFLKVHEKTCVSSLYFA